MDVRTDGTANWEGAPGQAANAEGRPLIDTPLIDTIEQLFEAGKELADAEVAWVKARAAYLGSALTWIAIFGVVALVLGFGLIVTLMVGSVLALAPHIGLGLALVAICLATGAVILFCVLAIKLFVRRIAFLTK